MSTTSRRSPPACAPAARCHIGEGAYVGAAACLREGITVGPRAMVGMGSVVTRDVPAERMWLGSPGRDAGPAPLPALVRESA